MQKDEAKGDGIGYKYAFDRISLCLSLKSSGKISLRNRDCSLLDNCLKFKQ